MQSAYSVTIREAAEVSVGWQEPENVDRGRGHDTRQLV
jgi:hypothetical protein